MKHFIRKVSDKMSGIRSQNGSPKKAAPQPPGGEGSSSSAVQAVPGISGISGAGGRQDPFYQFAFAYDAGTAVYSLLERDSKGEPTRRRLWVCCRRKINTIPPKNQYRLKKNRPEKGKVCKDDANEIYETGWIDEKDLEFF